MVLNIYNVQCDLSCGALLLFRFKVTQIEISKNLI